MPTDLTGLISGAVEANPLLGYGVIALVMLLENVIPPIPSEVVLPLAGYLVSRGQLALLPTVLAALAGTVLGACFWYGIGRLVPEERIERWLARHGSRLGLVSEDLARSRRWFAAHGSALVFWGRMVPGVRTLISVPAGLERMPQLAFLAWTTAGSLIWTVALTLAGRAMGQGYAQVARWLGPLAQTVEIGLIVALVVGVVALVIRATRQR
ncbi:MULTISPECIES: DedA family protein [Aphanothece]|uniref:DedA family protein n=1 Tax=Aphanothece TaxID=1121 RepID=UPI00398ECFB3